MEYSNNPVARFAAPEALTSAVLEGGTVDVVVRVPVGNFAASYALFRSIMDDGSPHLDDWLTYQGRSEDELKLLCGLLCTVVDELPMDTAHLLAWQETVGTGQYLDDFAIARVGRMEREAGERAALTAAVGALSRRADRDEEDGESPSMHMDGIVHCVWAGCGGRLDRLELASETLRALIRDEKAAGRRRKAA